ncbi:Hypothetical predicted protein [Prunus dulcis]|uniref:FAF domain-containing protein n=1 Tax=Prunus dulcis TaxID=3755 RepID=A0A5E4EAI6_PRUDU|nr:uncharacterized protein LOC117629984 [Prunus dulcis]VVA12763.1 Hypothetical predicted protein [Prunus dulcis]
MTPFFFSLLSFILFFFTFSLLYYNKKFPCYSYNNILFPIMMMSFCRKIAPHSFLGLTSTTTTSTTSTTASTSIDAHHEKLPFKCHHCISPLSCTASGGGGLLGLVNAPDYHHIKHQPLLLESSSIKSSSSSSDSSLSPLFSPSPPPPPAIEFEAKKDYAGGFGFIDDIGGGVDGLMSCTESLGFESSDERRVDDHQIIETIGHHHQNEDDDPVEEDACLRMMRQSMRRVSKWKRTGEKRAEAKKFPPPLSSLNQNGQPRYFLRPVRKDGRLELTEVRIYRPEILRAYRQDGRLRLHLVTHEPDLQEEEAEGIQEENEEEEEEEDVIDEKESIINVKEAEEEEEEEEERKLAVGGEGFRRCQNLVSGGHHLHRGNLGVWSQRQHCVTTR